MNSPSKLVFALIASAVVLSAGCERKDDLSTDGPTSAGNPSATTDNNPSGSGNATGGAMGGTPGTGEQGMGASSPASAASQ